MNRWPKKGYGSKEGNLGLICGTKGRFRSTSLKSFQGWVQRVNDTLMVFIINRSEN